MTVWKEERTIPKPKTYEKAYGEVVVFNDGTTVVKWSHKAEGQPITIFKPGYFDVESEEASIVKAPQD